MSDRTGGRRDGADSESEYLGGPTVFELDPLGPEVYCVARQYQAYLDSLVTRFGISSAQVPLLTYLWEGHTGDTQNDIARVLGVDKGTVSRNVQALVRLGLVTQRSSSRDSRACTVELTKQGWELARPVAAVCSSWAERVTDGLSENDRDAVLDTIRFVRANADRLLREQQAARESIPSS